MYKLDLHTHSVASNDGSIRPEQYQAILESGALDYVAITDHNRIDMAVQLQAELGDKIIIGEEISTTEGDIIGLYLKEPIEPHLTPIEAIEAIKRQGGLVYIPHPFETVRKGMSEKTLDQLATQIDIIEVHNGRAFAQNRSQKAIVWAAVHHTIRAASSDAHGAQGLTKTYTIVAEPPTRQNLLDLLSRGQAIVGRPPLKTLLYPKLNRARGHVRKYRGRA